MKKILVPLIVLALTLAVILPAAAAGAGPQGGNGCMNSQCGGANNGSGTGEGQPGGRGIFSFSGTIAAIGSNSVTIHALNGNKVAQPYLGTEITLTVDSQTRYLLKDGATATVIGFSDLQVGQAVSAQGELLNTVWMTSRITVGAVLTCLP